MSFDYKVYFEYHQHLTDTVDVRKLSVVGKSTDGSLVVYGAHVFHLIETHGISLSMILNYYKSQYLMVDWIGFILAATRNGWKFSTIKSHISEALFETHGPVYRDSVMEIINLLN